MKSLIKELSYDVAGRDYYTIAQALACAVACLGWLPETDQEPSNRADVQTILIALVSDSVERERLARGVAAHTARCRTWSP